MNSRKNVRIDVRVEPARDARRRDRDQEPIKYLTKDEVERFFRAIPKNRIRDVLLFDLAYRHGLRRSEAARLTLDDLRDGKIWVARCKHGLSNAYPLHPRSKRLLAVYLRERSSKSRISSPAERRTRRSPAGKSIVGFTSTQLRRAFLPTDRTRIASVTPLASTSPTPAGTSAMSKTGWDIAISPRRSSTSGSRISGVKNAIGQHSVRQQSLERTVSTEVSRLMFFREFVNQYLVASGCPVRCIWQHGLDPHQIANPRDQAMGGESPGATGAGGARSRSLPWHPGPYDWRMDERVHSLGQQMPSHEMAAQ
jgi:Phage integrase family